MWKFLILVVGVLFPWWSDAQESKEPWFITDVAVGDAGQVILSCRGDKSLKIILKAEEINRHRRE